MLGCWIIRSFLEAEITPILTSPRPMKENIQGLILDNRELVYSESYEPMHFKKVISGKLATAIMVQNKTGKYDLFAEKVSELKAFTTLLENCKVENDMYNALIAQSLCRTFYVYQESFRRVGFRS